MSDPIEKVVIVGGGTAGWMAASVLARVMGPLVRIELIESDAIGTVGVGEATIPQITLLLRVLGIDENDFLQNTQGSIKLGIRFNNWGKLGDSYIHAFGELGRPLGMLSFYPYWLRAQAAGDRSSVWDYCLNAVAADQNKYEHMPDFGNTGLTGLVPAYHFDASLVARYLRRLSEANGVVRTEGKVVDVSLNAESGFIESLKLENGATVNGELFIDCSGFRGLLIEQALQTGYEDWTHWLPCNRALAVPCESVEPLTPYTQSTARQAGWQWRIPLQHRTGNGHVYSSEYLSDDEAADVLLENLDGKPLAEPRPIRFTTGRRKQFWNRNCVALGLASGFLEPLESTSIHLVQSGIDRLIKYFPDKHFAQTTIDEFNRQSIYEFESVRDFIVLHYHANERTDSQFWIDRREMSVPEPLTRKIELFRKTGRVLEDDGDLFKEVAWVQVMLGQGVYPEQFHPLAERISEQQNKEFLGGLRQVIASRAESLSDHREYLNKHCAATEGT